jgi:hypothetical protein
MWKVNRWRTTDAKSRQKLTLPLTMWANTIFSSVSAWQNEAKHGIKHIWKIIYKDCLFWSNPLTNMATTDNSCFWLVDCKQNSALNPFGQIKLALIGNTLGRSSIQISHFSPIRYKAWPPQAIWVSSVCCICGTCRVKTDIIFVNRIGH